MPPASARPSSASADELRRTRGITPSGRLRANAWRPIRERGRRPFVRAADARAVERTKQVAHMSDAAPSGPRLEGRSGVPSNLAGIARSRVPMLREGADRRIAIYRQEVRRSPTSRSSWSRTSPTRRSSPSRTRGCSTSCANRAAADRHRRRAQGHQPLDLRPAGVLDTLVDSERLCDAGEWRASARRGSGTMFRFDGDTASTAMLIRPCLTNGRSRIERGMRSRRCTVSACGQDTKQSHIPDVLA